MQTKNKILIVIIILSSFIPLSIITIEYENSQTEECLEVDGLCQPPHLDKNRECIELDDEGNKWNEEEQRCEIIPVTLFRYEDNMNPEKCQGITSYDPNCHHRLYSNDLGVRGISTIDPHTQIETIFDPDYCESKGMIWNFTNNVCY